MDHLKFLAEQIHSTIAATVDDEGLPYAVQQEHRLRSGNFLNVCSDGAVEKQS